MSWWYLNSTTLSRMPNVLLGPIQHKVTSDLDTVWFDLKRKAAVTLKVMDVFGSRLFDSTRDTIAIGKNLHLVAVTAAPKGTEQQLVENTIYLYDAAFVYAPPTGSYPPTPPDSSIAGAMKDLFCFACAIQKGIKPSRVTLRPRQDGKNVS